MDDTALILNRDAVHNDNFVDRQFFPVRIERLLLTRLFDLACIAHHAAPLGGYFFCFPDS